MVPHFASMKTTRVALLFGVLLIAFPGAAEAGLRDCFEGIVWLARGKTLVMASLRGHWWENSRRWGLFPAPVRGHLPPDDLVAQNIEDTLAGSRLTPEEVLEREVAATPALKKLWERAQRRLEGLELRWSSADFCLREPKTIFLSPNILDTARPGASLLLRIEHELKHAGDHHLPDYERTFAEHSSDPEMFATTMLRLLSEEELRAIQAEIDLIPELRALGVRYPQVMLSSAALEVWRVRGQAPDYEIDVASLYRHGWHWRNWQEDIMRAWVYFSARMRR